jgi:tRNA threonylcarbamoyladenosine biosynthesis protein TsaE
VDSLTIYTNSASETRAAGHLIGEFARAGDVFLLTGPLGAGKTCLLQGIAQGWASSNMLAAPPSCWQHDTRVV